MQMGPVTSFLTKHMYADSSELIVHCCNSSKFILMLFTSIMHKHCITCTTKLQSHKHEPKLKVPKWCRDKIFMSLNAGKILTGGGRGEEYIIYTGIWPGPQKMSPQCKNLRSQNMKSRSYCTLNMNMQ